MAKFHKAFELSIDDKDLIETALRKRVAAQGIDCSAHPEPCALKHRGDDLVGGYIRESG